MYHRYFGLQEEPFSIAVNPRYLFMSDRHRDALAHMLYGVGAGGGFVLLTGEVGTGKTTINRCLLEQLPENTDIAIVLNPALNAIELLATVCDELGIDYPPGEASLKTLTDKLHSYLLDNYERGRRTVLLIDEAQHLQFDVLEQIRLLTNLETNTQKLLQIILVGQPELSEMLARPELRQLSQRISARFDLQPLNLSETRAYINHRLQVAGMPPSQQLFPDRVVRAIYKRSGGIPRLINLLCERMLLGSYGQNKSAVDMSVFRLAESEVFAGQSEQTAGGKFRRILPVSLVLILLAILTGSIWYFQPEMLRQDVVEPAQLVSPEVPVPKADWWFPQEETVLGELAAYTRARPSNAPISCSELATEGWECLALKADTWNELASFGRPVMLEVITDDRFAAYAMLQGFGAGKAALLTPQGIADVELMSVAKHWRGEFTLIWRPPEGFTSPLGLGADSPVIDWLAQTFARIDEQSQALSGSLYNEALAERVRLFQREQGLSDDGLVGVKTLLRLQQVADAEVALLQSASEAVR